MRDDVYAQAGYACRLEWGSHGARRAAARGDVIIVVDTLSFSTAVATAVAHGGLVCPCAEEEDPHALAARLGAKVAVGRRDVPTRGRFSLSPLTFVGMEPGTRIVLKSPNGATCSRHAAQVPALFAGALVNAATVAQAAETEAEAHGCAITVVACGERWETPNEDGALRVALEDHLGTGAILTHLTLSKSPEARVCEAAFAALCGDLAAVLWESGSGRELRGKGYGEDVRHAAQLNVYEAAPVMVGDWFTRWR
jgi:2-phosphosulfolactate phosphatase